MMLRPRKRKSKRRADLFCRSAARLPWAKKAADLPIRSALPFWFFNFCPLPFALCLLTFFCGSIGLRCTHEDQALLSQPNLAGVGFTRLAFLVEVGARTAG
jgi:hypothetical protein